MKIKNYFLSLITSALVISCVTTGDINRKSLISNLSVAQSQGSLSSSNLIKIRGSDLNKIVSISIENIDCPITSQTSSEIQCEILANLTPNYYDIKIKDKNSVTSTLSKAYAAGAIIIGAPDFQDLGGEEKLGINEANWIGIINGNLSVLEPNFGRLVSYSGIPSSSVNLDKTIYGNKEFHLLRPFEAGQDANSDGSFSWTPKSTCETSGRIFILDANYHRVLIYNSTPTHWLQKPDLVLGQIELTTAARATGSTTSSTLKSPYDIYCDSNYVAVSDRGNNRILIWTQAITTNGQAADLVLGQTDFTSGAANRGGSASATTLNSPGALTIKNGRLFVTDTNNHRVLVWQTIPTTNGQAADLVLGQTSFSTVTSGVTNSKFGAPVGVFASSNHLWISEQWNNRVVGYSLATPISSWSNGRSFDIVLGQANFTSNGGNRNGAISLNTMRWPASIIEIGSQLFVLDQWNRRILAWNTIPTINGQAADFQLGQLANNKGDIYPTLTSTSKRLMVPRSVTVDENGNIWAAEYLSNRLLRFNSPSTNYPTANLVIGQNDLTSSMKFGHSFAGNTSQAFGFFTTIFYEKTNKQLFVPDTPDHRILIFDNPSSNNQVPSIVLGQANFTTTTSGLTANKFNNPYGACRSGNYLFVTDRNNHRILRFSYPLSTNMNADLVLGQANFTTGSANKGGSPGPDTLNAPVGIYCDSNKLIVADTNNYRVLIWNTIPTANNQPADVVIGQPDFTTNSVNSKKVNLQNFNAPISVASDGIRLAIVDQYRYRVMLYNKIPTSNFASADYQIGQIHDYDNAYEGGTTEFENQVTSLIPYQVEFLDQYRIVVGSTNWGVKILPIPH